MMQSYFFIYATMDMKVIDEEAIDLRTEIRNTWEQGKAEMSQEVLAGSGLAGALVRILATSDKIDQILFDGKGNTNNSNICQKLIGNVREKLGFSRAGGVKLLLRQLGANDFQIEKWQKLIVDKNKFTSGKHDSKGIPFIDRSDLQKDIPPKFFT